MFVIPGPGWRRQKHPGHLLGNDLPSLVDWRALGSVRNPISKNKTENECGRYSVVFSRLYMCIHFHSYQSTNHITTPPTPWRTYQIIDHLFHQGNIQNLFISKFYLFITYSFFFSLSLVCVVVWGVQQRIIFRNHFSPSAMYISGIKFSSPCLAETPFTH